MKKTIKLKALLCKAAMQSIAGVIAIVAIIGFTMAACSSGGGGGSKSNPGGPSGNVTSAKFWAQNSQTEAFYQITANKLAENSLCEVWVEQGTSITDTQAKAIADEFSANIHPKIVGSFSKSIDVPLLGKTYTSSLSLAYDVVKELTGKQQSKLTILCLDIKDGFNGGGYVAGYFAFRDFLSKEDVKDIDSSVESNERALIYVDTNPGYSSEYVSEFYNTIAHELQHLINFAVDIALEKGGLTDIWINEGLSSAAEYIYAGGHLQARINDFNNDATGLIGQGDNFFAWDNYADQSKEANLNDYATVYLFFQWLRLKSGGSNDVYKNIIFSDYTDHRAVVNAMSGFSDWPSLLEGWLKANYYKNNTHGYGIDSKLNSEVQISYAPGNGGVAANFPLAPGEAVYSKATSFTVPSNSGNINNVGLASGGTVSNGNSVTGALLSYNKNTNIEGSSENGRITGVAANISKPLVMPDSLRGPYVISFAEMAKRSGRNTRALDLSIYYNSSSKLLKGVSIEN